MKYNIAETFYSLKGEGKWTGKPMTFIRLSGCNINCEFCDTKHTTSFEYDIGQLMTIVSHWPAERVVITGGEPLLQDVGPLVQALRSDGYLIHLETNGSQDMKHLYFNWVSVSPKNFESIHAESLVLADEIKFLCGQEGWRELIDQVEKAYPFIFAKYLFLMPVALNWESGNRDPEDILWANVREAIEYCKEDPRYSLCMQMHKILNIP